MDVLDRVAKAIAEKATALKLRTEGFQCEIEESKANIKESHFVLSWLPSVPVEPQNMGDVVWQFTNVRDPLFNKPDTAYYQAIPIRLVFTSLMSGEKWRNDMLRYTTEFNILFHQPFNVPAMSTSQNLIVELIRTPDEDIMEDQTEGELDSGYLLNQVWLGYIFMGGKNNNIQEL